MTDQEILEISGRFGTMNDFGKTFFTDEELLDFVHEVLSRIPAVDNNPS